MDSSHFLVRQATSISEYKAGQKIRMKGRGGTTEDGETSPKKGRKKKDGLEEDPGVVVDEEESTITGFPAAGDGVSERPWFNYEEGIAGCTCRIFSDGEVTFCRHILGLFESLNTDEEKYGEAFLKKFMGADAFSSSSKTKSGSVSTGLASVDDLLCGGIPKSVVTVLAGMTKVGKTWFAIQTAFNAIMNNMNVLYIDSESTFVRQDGFGYFEGLLRKRFKYDEDIRSHIHFIPEYEIGEIAKYFGLDVYVADTGRKATAYLKHVTQPDNAPIVHLCRAKKIDLVVFDSLTDLLKPYFGDEPDNRARGEVINALWPAFEAVARVCDLAFILINHSTRSYQFKLYTDKDGRGVLDEPVTYKNLGVWGSTSLMFNVKHFLQIEDCEREWCNKPNLYVKHFMRRLFAGLPPAHVDLEFVRDYGYIER